MDARVRRLESLRRVFITERVDADKWRICDKPLLCSSFEPVHQEIRAHAISISDVGKVCVAAFRENAGSDQAGRKARARGAGNIVFEAVADAQNAA